MLPVRLKWPNDVEIYGKKVAGILCEAVLHPAASPLVIIGIGINVNTALEQFPPELHQHVTSLALPLATPGHGCHCWRFYWPIWNVSIGLFNRGTSRRSGSGGCTMGDR